MHALFDHDPKVLWGFIQRLAPEANPENAPVPNSLVGYAVRYYDSAGYIDLEPQVRRSVV